MLAHQQRRLQVDDLKTDLIELENEVYRRWPETRKIWLSLWTGEGGRHHGGERRVRGRGCLRGRRDAGVTVRAQALGVLGSTASQIKPADSGGQHTATGIHREATKGLCTNPPCMRPITMRCILPDGSVYERCVCGHAVERKPLDRGPTPLNDQRNRGVDFSKTVTSASVDR